MTENAKPDTFDAPWKEENKLPRRRKNAVVVRVVKYLVFPKACQIKSARLQEVKT